MIFPTKGLFMKNTKLYFSLTMAIGMCAGHAISADTPSVLNNYPDAIAHPDELFMQQVASRMFNSLTQEEKIIIAKADGIGSENFDLEAFNFEFERNEDIPLDITAQEYSKMVISDELAERLTDQQWNIINSIIESIDSGIVVPQLCFSPDTDTEYAYAVNQLLELPLQTRFQQNARWSSTATDGGGLSQGTPTTITYSYVPDGTFVPNLGIGLGSGNSALFSWLNGIYGSPATWQNLFTRVFDRWAELTGLSYVYEPNDDGSNLNGGSGQLGVRGDVRIAAFDFQNDGNGGVLAYNNFPQDGDMVFDAFDTFYNNTTSDSLRFRNVTAHEHGHGLGMLHVCPAVGQKLMEPFISTAYDGPQIDDILNGIRHYGDIAEPNDNIAQATDLGTLPIGGFVNMNNVGIDDNSDDDYYRITLSEPSRVNFGVTPNADEYLQGPQTNDCNGGTLTDYNSIQNLRIVVQDSGGNTLVTVNETGTGSGETLIFDAQTAGDYYFVIDGATSINNVQRYLLSALITDIPFLVPTIAADAPVSIAPGVPNEFDVTIDPREDTIVPGTENLFVSINGSAFTSSPLTFNGGDSYTATIPSADCDDTVEFYVEAEGDVGGTISFPEDGASAPLTAFVGEVLITLDDDFETNMGWTVSGPVSGTASGEWERGVPAGDADRGDPSTDADGSGQAYLTGNAAGNTDVDGGETILTSPVFELADNPEAMVSYSRWYDNTGSGTGGSPGADIFTVEISNNNGGSWQTLETVGPSTPQSSGGWFNVEFRVADFVAVTDQVRIRFIADDAGTGSVIEAAVDAVLVSGQSCEDPMVDECPADFTGEGDLNFFDISAFLTAFNSQDPSADFTGDGTFNFFDVSAFLTAFNAGCP
tara:strand:- start:377481 stop:380096 length:2616 start_codon:yes stop_codon:yes gene_type:complete